MPPHIDTHKAHPIRLVAVEEVLCTHGARGQVPALVVRKLGQVHAAVALHAMACIQAKPGTAAAQVAIRTVVNLHEDTRHDSARAGAGDTLLVLLTSSQLHGLAVLHRRGRNCRCERLTWRPGTSSHSLQIPQKYAASFSPHPLHSPARDGMQSGTAATSSQEQGFALSIACCLASPATGCCLPQCMHAIVVTALASSRWSSASSWQWRQVKTRPQQGATSAAPRA
jgi:hypothetical protein